MSGQASGSEAIRLLHGQPGSGRDWARVVALFDSDAVAPAPDRRGWDGRSRGAGLALNGRAAHLLLQLHPKRLTEVIRGRERVPVA